ncbi:isoprenyl transferase [Cellulomonas xiejunii]|uniref:Isoprenyl transferase n=1 Tax=Cellulomonas xiejunii TaxID=2968083 RepID=A0ABY5KU58_9CELL|nr:isoprenyl transferase [Cellulomonas xiejunii]MCC2314526.1 isoprenyl transferase [Cellulomonas xiejunii]MCC2322759.1 isoprenyl transferase [Cellulomonas xiejunii]UUI72787.1 isoprenyl transferase [Cellulomonas xiejunii]
MRLPHPLYGLYERRLAASLHPDQVPRHVGVILDGNRRWARDSGLSSATGHRRGADKISDLLQWSENIGVEVVTLWLLSTDNLARDPAELGELLRVIEDVVGELAAERRWRIQAVGALDMLPDCTAAALKAAQDATADVQGLHVNAAVGYGGRREIADAVRAFLRMHADAGSSLDELAEAFDVEHITQHLYTKGQPDPDLVIRTSGEQRLGGFLLWQSAHSEFYFCDAYWPDFRRVDFLRAVRAYSQRERRLGR